MKKVELSEYDYKLLRSNSLINDVFGMDLSKAESRDGYRVLTLSPLDLNELIGFVAAETNHAKDSRIQNDLNNLCDYLESL